MFDRPSERMRRRVLIWLTLLIMIVAGYTVWCIYKVSIVESNKWSALANSQQLTSTTVKASRGTIYDCNKQVLAQSATVYTVYSDNAMLWEYINAKDQKIIDIKDALADEDNEERREELTKMLEEAENTGECERALNEFMPQVLGIDEGEFLKKISDKTIRYTILKKEVEKTDADKIERFMTEHKLDGIRCDPTSKRFYPQNSLAANVIGHTDYEGNGVYGLEAYYDDKLSGVDGRIITAADKYGTEIPYKYKQSYDAQDGDSLYLNIDMSIQYYLEKALANAVQTNMPSERACGIIMEPKTGRVLAMATNYSYDPNKPSAITDTYMAARLAMISESAGEESKEYTDTRLAAWSIQWKNKAISELYFPGSVFKVITGSAALEENAISLSETFYCGTQIEVQGASAPYHCWSNEDHGPQTLQDAMTNSCNPAFIRIGQKLGIDNFWKYLKGYGFTDYTGIDLPGEAMSITRDGELMSLVDLASESFGQTNKITPIQMITAYSAVINGGYLMTPQIVDKIIDSNGNIVKDFEPVAKRQVISESVSAEMRNILENVVLDQQGSNAYIQGYRIGGKSGTSQKLDIDPTGQKDYVASYCAFAPANDPQVVVLIMVDDPQGEKFYGSQVAAPACVEVLTDVLPYMGLLPEYTDEELAQLEVAVPNEEYLSVSEAKSTLEALMLNVKVVGSGDTVLRQSPSGVTIERGGQVVLYTDNITSEETVTVPNVEGYSKEEARELLHRHGLNMTIVGSAANEEDSLAEANSMTGRTVTVGTAITVTFRQAAVGSQ